MKLRQRLAAWKWLCKGNGREAIDVPDWANGIDSRLVDLFYPDNLRYFVWAAEAPKRPVKVRRCNAARKQLRAYIRGTGKDVTVISLHSRIDDMALEYSEQCPFELDTRKKDPSGFPCTVDEDFGVCLQLAGRGWKVVAAYLGSAMVQSRYGQGRYKRDNCYYLAINSVTAQAILFPFYPDYYSEGHYDEGSDGLMRKPPPDCQWGARPALLGMDRALRSILSPRPEKYSPIFPWLLKLSCLEMMSYAESKVDPVDLRLQRRLQPQPCYSEAVAALYATFMWTCPLVLSAGPFLPWRMKVWTPRRVRGIVRLQACVRGWLLRRRLYSPHTELGQRRLQLLWASFQHDYRQ